MDLLIHHMQRNKLNRPTAGLILFLEFGLEADPISRLIMILYMEKPLDIMKSTPSWPNRCGGKV